MNNVRREFNERAKDLNAAVDIVVQISQSGEYSNEGLRSLRASCYLLMYNVVEATARLAIMAIFDHLTQKKVCFDTIRSELKLFVWKQSKAQNPKDFVDRLNKISMSIVSECLRPESLFSGNVDARKLREFANQLGYSKQINLQRPAQGIDPEECLLRIKSRRNSLAHGHESFGSLGKNITQDDLRRDTKITLRYLDEVIKNVSSYISNEDYLAKSS